MLNAPTDPIGGAMSHIPVPSDGGDGQVGGSRLRLRMAAYMSSMAAFVLGAAMTILALRPVSDFDTWWHIRTGEQIVRQGTPRTHDVFSHTLEGAGIVTHSWLAELGFYLIWKQFGIWGLRALNAVFMAACLAFVWRLTVHYRITPLPRLCVFATTSLLIQPFIAWRPQAASVLLMIAVFSTVTAPTRIRIRSRRFALLVAIMIVWANLHPLVLTAVGLLWLALVGGASSRLLRERVPVRFIGVPTPRGLRRGAIAGLILTAATLVNPNGLQLHRYAIEGASITRAQALNIQEWGSPLPGLRSWVHRHLIAWDWTGLTTADLDPALLLAAFFALFTVGWGVVRVRREFDARVLLVSCLCVIASLLLIRARWLLVFPIVHAFAISGSTRPNAHRSIGMMCAAGLMWGASLMVTSMRVGSAGVLAQRAEAQHFPKGLCDFIEDAALEGNLFNPYDWGGYLIYRLYPQARVFIDGRNVDYHWHDPSIVSEYLTAQQGGLEAMTHVLEQRAVRIMVWPSALFALSAAHLEGKAKADALTAGDAGCMQVPPQGWECVFVNREGSLFLQADDAESMSRCDTLFREFGLKRADWRPFRPRSVIDKSPHFAARYGLVVGGLCEITSLHQASSLIRRADALGVLRDYPSAADLYEQALTFDGKNKQALLGAAYMNHHLARIERARELAVRAYGLYPHDREVMRLYRHVLSPH